MLLFLSNITETGSCGRGKDTFLIPWVNPDFKLYSLCTPLCHWSQAHHFPASASHLEAWLNRKVSLTLLWVVAWVVHCSLPIYLIYPDLVSFVEVWGVHWLSSLLVHRAHFQKLPCLLGHGFWGLCQPAQVSSHVRSWTLSHFVKLQMSPLVPESWFSKRLSRQVPISTNFNVSLSHSDKAIVKFRSYLKSSEDMGWDDSDEFLA